MGSIKRWTKKILSITIILTIIINLVPNFGLLKSNASIEAEKVIVIKPDSNEFTSVTNGDRMFKLNVYLNNVTTSIFSLQISYPTDKLTTAELSKVNIPGYGEITSLTESTNFKKVAEFTNLINNPYDLSLVNNNILTINAMEEYSNDFNANGEVLVCSICFKVKESVENFSDLSYKDFKIDIDNSFINIEGEELSNKSIYSVEEFADSSLPKVQSIAVKTNPTEGKKYIHGDTIDLEAGELTVTYTDGSTKDISMKEEGVIVKTGEQIGAIADINNLKLTFEYEDVSTELEVNVVDPIENIEFYDKNNVLGTLTFYDGDIIPIEELFIKAITKSGNTNEISLSDSRISLNSEEADIKRVKDAKYNSVTKESAGIQEIEITYKDEESEKTTLFNIMVNDKIKEIKISETNAPEAILTVGSTFAKSGSIEIIGLSGISYGEIVMSSGDVTVTEVDGSEVDLSQPTENKVLKVTYAGVNTTYTVNVEDTIKEIRVNGKATTKYNEVILASDFDGITITEIMASGAEGATVPLNFTWIDTTTYNNKISKQQELTVNYPNNGKIIEGKVTVQVEDKLLGIRVENLKNEYVYKDELNYEGAELYTQYVSGEYGPVNLSDFDFEDAESELKVTGFDNTKIGEQEITFTYNDGTDEVSTKVTVNVGKATLEAPECEQLEIVEGKALSTIQNGLPSTEYGDVIWKDGTRTLTYVEGADNIHEIDATYKMNTANAPYYNDVDCKIQVKVLKRDVSKIEVTTPPTDIEYVEGQDFDPTGMVITVTYNDGDTTTIASDYATKGVTFAPSTTLQTTDTQVTVTYSGKTATQDITVVEKKVTSIAVTKGPDKASYVEGQALDLKGMVVTATYNDGDVQVTTEYTTKPANGATLALTDTEITVTYTGTDAVVGIATDSTTITVETKKVTSIAVTTVPTKTSYVEGQALELAGMVVTATYNDGDTKTTTDYTTAPANGATLNTVGTQTIEVTYTGTDAVAGIEKTKTSVEVAKKVVTNIEVTTPPTTTNYVEGHPFEPAGMVVTAYYNDGTDAPTTDYTISPSGDLTPANTEITITYNGTDIAEDASAPTANVAITVSERQVESIEITKAPTKVNYIEGQDFEPTGMEITVNYNDHEKPLVISSDYATKGVTFAPSASLQVTDNKIVVSYRGFTDNQAITVIEDYVADITLKAPSKLEYNYGDAIDLAGATITKVWASGLKHENDTIPMTKDMLSNIDITSFDNMNSLGTKEITVTYGTVVKANAFQIEIKDYINSIEIEDKTKLQEVYEYGDTINVTNKDTGADLYILAKYAGGTPDKKVILTTDMVSGFNMNKVGNQTVIVTYEGKTDTYTINVQDKVIGIDITKEPAKKVYKLNEAVSFNDIVIKNIMASGATGATLTASEYTIGAVDTTTVGEKEVTVSRIGTTFADTFKVKVIDATEDMSITKIPETSYKYGDALNITDGEITVITQTETKVIPMTDAKVKVTGYNPNRLGDQTLTVTYTYSEETDNGMETKQKTDTYTVNVKDYATGIAITRKPNKLTYEYGEALELAGGKVAEKMASGATRNEVDITGEMVSGYEKTKEGTQVITVTYLGKTATFDVTVMDSTLGISMKTLPNKTEYTQGNAIDVTGAVLNVTKSSGIKEIAVTKEMISGYDPNKVGTQVITVTYDGFTTEFVVNVKAKTVVKPNKPNKPNKPTNSVNPSEPSTSEVIKYTVTFINYDGTILKMEEVESGKSATAPELEERKGYKFIGWDTEFDVVEEDLNVMVQYEKIEVTTKPSEKPSQVLGVKDETNSTENDITSTLIPALAGVTISGLLLLLITAITKKNVEIYAVSEGERKLLGKEKVTKKYRTVSIDKYKEELQKGSIEVVLNSRISKKLNEENVDIILNEKELTYRVKVNENEAFVIEIKNK